MSSLDPIRPPISSVVARTSSAAANSAQDDLAACRAILAEGSKSFAAASRLLPARIRGPAAAFYAFCRIADDLVDYDERPADAVAYLHDRLDRIYEGRADDDPVDRALTRVIREHDLPRPLFDALIDGFAWDAQERLYEDLDELEAYCARVAATVGVVMTLLMGPRDRVTLARACDLGVAMQLTNIARDVAEDAARGRCYLPRAWLRELGVEPATFMATPARVAGLPLLVRRLLDEAGRLYARADAGIVRLPRDSRAAIRAARLIYADIARVLAARGNDPLRGRAFVSRPRKLWLLLRAFLRPTPARADPQVETAEPLSAVRFLIDAVTPAATP